MEDTNAEAVVQEEAEPVAEEVSVEAPPAPDELSARQFAALARRERQVREGEQLIREKDAELAANRASLEMAKTNPMAFLQQAGISEDDLVRHMIDANGTPTQEELIRRQAEEIKSLRADFSDYKTNQELTKTKQSNEAQWDAFIDNTRKEVENSEGLTLVKEFGAHKLVADVILEYHKQHGEVLPVAQAGKLIEQHITGEAEKFFKNETLRKQYSEYLTPAEESSKSPDTPTPSQRDLHAAKVPRTLTNTLAAATPNRSNGVLTEQDSLDRMVDTLRWSE